MTEPASPREQQIRERLNNVHVPECMSIERNDALWLLAELDAARATNSARVLEPQIRRFDIDSRSDYQPHEDPSGVWMRANDVLAELDAARTACAHAEKQRDEWRAVFVPPGGAFGPDFVKRLLEHSVDEFIAMSKRAELAEARLQARETGNDAPTD